MALTFYKKKAAMVISYGKRTKKSQQGEYSITTINFQLAPYLKDNPVGMGSLYDWKNKKIIFQLSLTEALSLAERITIANQTKKWDECKLYHKYYDHVKTLSIAPYQTIYMIYVQSDDIKINLGLTLVEMKMFVDYLKFAVLSEMIKDGEYYFQHIDEIQKKNQQQNNVSEDVEEENTDSFDTFSDVDFDS